MAHSKTRRLIYKKAEFLKESGDSSLTLEKLLRLSVKKLPRALQRSENPQQDDVGFRFLNYAQAHNAPGNPEMIYGCEFLAFEKGADQSTIKIDPAATEVDISALTAANGEEFLGGSVYFGVVGNHVILVQSTALRSFDLEAYLNWLFVEKARLLPSDNRVALSDYVTKKRKAYFKDVTGIEIEAPVHLRPQAAAEVQRRGYENKRETERSLPVTIGGTAWEAVKALFGAALDSPGGLSVANLSSVPEVEVRLFLKWKAKRDEGGEDFIASIAKNMSHIDEEFDYTVHTKAGTIGKSDLKLQHPQSIRWEKGRPRFDDIFPKMSEWLAHLVETGRVDA